MKASACGNDFLLIQKASIPTGVDIHVLTKRICDRHEGVGADGVEWILPQGSTDVEIQLINADGSEAEISGNGTRCVAAHLCSEGKKEEIKIQTGAGLRTCILTSRHDCEYEFEMAMGDAMVESELVLTTGAGEVRGIPVSVGNPHYVVFVSAFAADWQARAAEIQRSSHFKHGVNVEFVTVDGRHDVRTRFFERGVGETQSSGTGSCAAAVAALATGRADSPVSIHATGGTQTVRREGDSISLRGSARLLCRGEFFLS